MHGKFKPDRGFFRYVRNQYPQEHFGNDPTDEIIEKLLLAAYGLTAWIRSRCGAEWTFSLMGIEEVIAHDGYTYWYVPQRERRKLIDTTNGFRVFRRIPPVPVTLDNDALLVAKRVVFTEGWTVPRDDMVKFVFACYARWLKTKHAHDWLCSTFDPIKYVSSFGSIAYKCISHTGDTFWFDERSVITEAKGLETCTCCEMSYPCTDSYSGLGVLCVRCYSEHFSEPELLKF